jgi:hypothetical protein
MKAYVHITKVLVLVAQSHLLWLYALVGNDKKRERERERENMLTKGNLDPVSQAL